MVSTADIVVFEPTARSYPGERKKPRNDPSESVRGKEMGRDSTNNAVQVEAQTWLIFV